LIAPLAGACKANTNLWIISFHTTHSSLVANPRTASSYASQRIISL
jgi:hypothetical protein